MRERKDLLNGSDPAVFWLRTRACHRHTRTQVLALRQTVALPESDSLSSSMLENYANNFEKQWENCRGGLAGVSMAAVLFVIIDAMQHCKEESGRYACFLSQRTIWATSACQPTNCQSRHSVVENRPSTVGYRQSAVYHKRHSHLGYCDSRWWSVLRRLSRGGHLQRRLTSE